MSRKTVLLFIDSLESGGAQRQMVLLANTLGRRGYDVTLLTYYPGDQLGKWLDPGRVRRQLVQRNSTFDLGYCLRLFRYLRSRRPDCVISYLATPNLLASTLGRAAGVPRVITSERNINLPTAALAVMVRRAIARLSDAVVVNSREGHRRLLRLGIPEGRVAVIYNGLDEGYFVRQPQAVIDATRQALGVPPGEILVLLPGRMEAQKNHRVLVDALALLQPPGALRVAFAGNEFDTAIKADLARRIEAARLGDRVLFLGPRADMPALYSAADLVVLPSLWEGFPNAVVEAMACATPVIASDVSDNGYIVAPGTGLLFRSDDAASLADALRRFAALPPAARRAMGEAAASRALAICSAEVLADRYVALIEGADAP